MARETLLEGQRVRCSRLCDAGFAFTHPTLDGALRAAVDGTRPATDDGALNASARRR
jgi:NAD dependent epimerase/dehydratase family enzyme